MLFFLTFSVCLSIVLSIPSEYFELKAPQEVQNCIDEHLEVVRVCTLSYMAIILNGTLKYDELMKSNPEAVPDSEKKNFCCNIHRLEKCFIDAVSSTPGCEKLLQEYFKIAETYDAKPPEISLKKLCVKYPIDSNDCE
jgi:hypothetical protein